MITRKSVRCRKEAVIRFETAIEAVLHFTMCSTPVAIGGHVKVGVVSISRNSVTTREDNALLGQEDATYSGDEEEMTTIVVLASKLLWEEKSSKAAEMMNEALTK